MIILGLMGLEIIAETTHFLRQASQIHKISNRYDTNKYYSINPIDIGSCI